MLCVAAVYGYSSEYWARPDEIDAEIGCDWGGKIVWGVERKRHEEHTGVSGKGLYMKAKLLPAPFLIHFDRYESNKACI